MRRKVRERVPAAAAALILAGAMAAAVFAAPNGPRARSSRPSAGDVEARVEAILARMSLAEKIELIGGVDGFYVRGFPALGLPPLRMADGPMGVRNNGPATAMPGGINLAATWDPGLAWQVGEQIGRDARAKGVHFLLGPGVNIYRAPMNGRNFEYFGEDPFLASRIAVGYIEGVQSEGVSATVKHFLGNNSEFARHTTDDIIDERTLREIYLPVFEAAVKQAHVGAVMDSYNLVNGEHMTQNRYLNRQVLQEEWGFQGVLMSDWFATYDGIAAAKSGLDLEMPSGAFMNRAALLPAVQDGRVSVDTINDKVRRILRLAVASHWLDRGQTDLSIPRYNLPGRRIALKASLEGMVLLKNDAHLLPLDGRAVHSIAVIGPDAYPAVPVGGGSAGVRPFAAVSFLEGVANRLGPSVPVYYDRGIPPLSDLAQRTDFLTAASGGLAGLVAEYFSGEDLRGRLILQRTDPHINFGEVPGADLGARWPSYPRDAASGRWTGYYTAPAGGGYDCFVESTGEAGGYYRVWVDGKIVLDNGTQARALTGFTTLSLESGLHQVVVERRGRPGFLGARFRFGIVRQDAYVTPEAEKMAASAGAVILAVGFDPQSESEGADRTFGLPPGQDELIEEIASLNPRTIVVLTSGGAVDMTRWLRRVPAVLESWYAGQEGGTALAQILFGDADPSGRLPVTFERRWEDNPAHDSYYPAPGSSRVVYREGVFVGYRGYERSGIQPLFPFGFGLSYTTFRYSGLEIRRMGGGAKPRGTSQDGLRYEVSWSVTNTGKRGGADVSEVYIGELHPAVPRPARELKGLVRTALQPGETRRAKIVLDRRAFSYFDANAREWRADPGPYAIFVGRSVEQLPLRGTIVVAARDAAAAARVISGAAHP